MTKKMDEDEVVIDSGQELLTKEPIVPQKTRNHAVMVVRAAFLSIIVSIAALVLHEIAEAAPKDDWKVPRTVLLTLNVVIAILTLCYSNRISLERAIDARDGVSAQKSAQLEWVSSLVGGTKVTLRGSPPLIIVDHNPLVDELFGGKMLGQNICDRIRDGASKLAFLKFISTIENQTSSSKDVSPVTVVFTDRQMRRFPCMLDGRSNSNVNWKEVSINITPTLPKTFSLKSNFHCAKKEKDSRAAKEKKQMRRTEKKQARVPTDSTTRSTSAQSGSTTRDTGKPDCHTEKPKTDHNVRAEVPDIVVSEGAESPQDKDVRAMVYPPVLIGRKYEIMDGSGNWVRGTVEEMNEDQTYQCELAFGDTTSRYTKVSRSQIRDVVKIQKPIPESQESLSKYDAAEEVGEAAVKTGEAPVNSGEVAKDEVESEDSENTLSYHTIEETGEAAVSVSEGSTKSGEAGSGESEKPPSLTRNNRVALCLKGHPVLWAPEDVRERKCVMCMMDNVAWCCAEFDTCTFLLCISCNDKMDKVYEKQAEMQARRKISQAKKQSEGTHVQTPSQKHKNVKQAVNPEVRVMRGAKEKSPQQPSKPARLQPLTNDISTLEDMDANDRSEKQVSGTDSLPDSDDLDDKDLEDSDSKVRLQERKRKTKENPRKKRALEKEKLYKMPAPSDPHKRQRRSNAPVAIMTKKGKGDLDWGTAMKRIKGGEVGSYTTPRFSADEQQPAKWDEPRKATMWTYNPKDDQWVQESMMVQIMLTPFSSGGMRDCFKMRSVSPVGLQPIMNAPPMVAKVFKDASTVSSEEYFNEAMTQMISEDFAKRFNKLTPKECNVTFIGVKVMRTERSPFTLSHHPRGSLFNIEPFLMGEYEKYSDNCGRIWENENSWLKTALPPVFSHFSYEESGLLLCVTDIQGVGRWYTDPQIHSHDGSGFGMGNLGQMGLKKFIGSHVCNDLCVALKLSPLGCKDKAFLKRMNENRQARRLVSTTAIVDRTGNIVMKKWQRSAPVSILETLKDNVLEARKKAKKKDRGGVIQQIKKSLIKK